MPAPSAESAPAGPLEAPLAGAAGSCFGAQLADFFASGVLSPLAVVFTQPAFATVAVAYARLIASHGLARYMDLAAIGLSPAFVAALGREGGAAAAAAAGGAVSGLALLLQPAPFALGLDVASAGAGAAGSGGTGGGGALTGGAAGGATAMLLGSGDTPGGGAALLTGGGAPMPGGSAQQQGGTPTPGYA